MKGMRIGRVRTAVGRSRLRLLLAGLAALALVAIGAGPAGAWAPRAGMGRDLHGRFPGWFHHRHHGHTQVCAGTPEAPGVLSGVYYGDVAVEGACVVNAGQAVVFGDLIVRPGAALLAGFALNDETGSGSSGLTVGGNVLVQSGAAAVMGCEAEHFPCFDDNPEAPTLSSADHIGGSLLEQQPLGVVFHDSTVGGSIVESGGGGGLTCEPSGPFALFGVPVYSDYEDLTVRGSLEVGNLTSCWLGVARVQVGGDLRMIGNQLADPDAIEIIANQIRRNLACFGNSQVWDSADLGEEGLYPRLPEPNTVGGKRLGQCVLASPETEGGPLGPGPF